MKCENNNQSFESGYLTNSFFNKCTSFDGAELSRSEIPSGEIVFFEVPMNADEYFSSLQRCFKYFTSVNEGACQVHWGEDPDAMQSYVQECHPPNGTGNNMEDNFEFNNLVVDETEVNLEEEDTGLFI